MCVCVTQLSQQVEQDEDVGEEASAAPGGVDVLALLAPLEPHPDAVLQEGADQAEPGHVGEVVFGDPQELKTRAIHDCEGVTLDSLPPNFHQTVKQSMDSQSDQQTIQSDVSQHVKHLSSTDKHRHDNMSAAQSQTYIK